MIIVKGNKHKPKKLEKRHKADGLESGFAALMRVGPASGTDGWVSDGGATHSANEVGQGSGKWVSSRWTGFEIREGGSREQWMKS
jgi:hypothetical protein